MRKHMTGLCFLLLCLAGCANLTATGTALGTTPTPARTATPTATATLVPTATTAPAPTPTNVPAGWRVLAGRNFAIAYPSEWTAQPPVPNTDTTVANAVGYTYPLSVASDGRTLNIYEEWNTDKAGAYCHVTNGKTVTLAGAKMQYTVAGNSNEERNWLFADSHNNLLQITLNDALSPAKIALDNTLLATLRLTDLTPFRC